MDDDEVVLHGGNTNVVVRVGETVRRTAGPWTPAVHALLRHLHTAGFDAAPRPFGVDAKGREILSFIHGDTVTYPMPGFVWSDATLCDVGRLLRRYHDLTLSLAAGNGQWRPYAEVAGPPEVICHCDWGPYNAIFREERLIAMVDWDFARPGSRLADLAYAAYTWVPMQPAQEYQWQGAHDVASQGRRLRLLCDAYGLEDRTGVLPALNDRLTGLIDWIEDLAAKGAPGFTGLLQSFRASARYLDARASALDAAL
jgi:hypothetical protein